MDAPDTDSDSDSDSDSKEQPVKASPEMMGGVVGRGKLENHCFNV